MPPSGKYRSAEFWTGGVAENSSGTYREFLDLLERKQIARTIAREGQILTVSNDLRLEVVYAPKDLRDLPENINDWSLVIVAHLEGASVLLTGDIEATGQQSLLGFHPDLNCEILKVPHQGAANATTSGLLDACKPEMGVISVAKGNQYGHPSRQAFGLLKDRGAEVLRTDLNGDITLSVTGDRIGVATQRGPPH